MILCCEPVSLRRVFIPAWWKKPCTIWHFSGVSHVEIFINSHSELRRSFVDTLARLLQRFDMTCASLHPYTCEIEPNMLFSNYARRVDDYLEYCRYYFTAMQQLGAKVFVLHGNKVPAASVTDGEALITSEKWLAAFA